MHTEAIASQANTEALEPKRWCHLAYECPNCQMIWQDQWDVVINSDCPNCGTENIEPQEVVNLAR
jgi:predicted Zn-ribbon and HTH transcriptional regulator